MSENNNQTPQGSRQQTLRTRNVQQSGKGRRRRRGIPRFYIIYLITLSAVLLLIVLAQGPITSLLEEYEAAQPIHLAEELFGEYFDPIDYEALLAVAEYDSGDVPNESLIAYMTSEIGDEELSFSKGTSSSEDDVKYIVKAGNIRVAAINLTKSEEETSHGFTTYELVSLELYLTVTDTYVPNDTTDEPTVMSVTVSVPTGYTVTVDGEGLTETYIEGTYTETESGLSLPTDMTGISYTSYKLTGLTELPGSVVVTSAEGAEAEVTYDESTYTYKAAPAESASLSEEYSEFVVTAVENYAAYIQCDKGESSLYGYFDTDTDLYAAILEAGTARWMVTDHTGYDYEGVSATEFYALTDSVFACRISFTHILYDDDSEWTDYIDKYVFLH
ncbi:MAG: hypothetical protein LUH54_05800, partial [Firmicutes bacterium]|nr:hypothetical protein [Bacillota bacterium]